MLACISRTRHARSPQRVVRAPDKSHSRLHFAHSTRTISGCAHMGQIALSPAFRALDTRDLRRGLRAHGTNRTLACISHTRHARSPKAFFLLYRFSPLFYRFCWAFCLSHDILSVIIRYPGATIILVAILMGLPNTPKDQQGPCFVVLAWALGGFWPPALVCKVLGPTQCQSLTQGY